MNRPSPTINRTDLTQEDLDFLSSYEWKRTKQKEIMTQMLSIFRSNPNVSRNIFVNAWKSAQAFVFQDPALEKVAEEQENSKTQVLEEVKTYGQK
jgi:hypothetical protein